MNLLAQLSTNTQVVISVGGLVAILGGIVTFMGTLIALVWRAANKLGGIEQGIDRMATAIRDCWTKHDQERWAYKLEKANRKNGLVVPSPVSDSQHGTEE